MLDDSAAETPPTPICIPHSTAYPRVGVGVFLLVIAADHCGLLSRGQRAGTSWVSGDGNDASMLVSLEKAMVNTFTNE